MQLLTHVSIRAPFYVAAILVAVGTAHAQHDATFDTYTEGVIGLSFTDGGVTFSNLDCAFPGGSNYMFIVEESDGDLTGHPGFTTPNTLGFFGYSPGPQTGYSRCKSFDMSTGQIETFASLEIYELPSHPGNTIALEGVLAGTVVAAHTITVPTGFSVHHHSLSVTVPNGFNTLRLVGGGAQDSGVFFAVVDTVHFGSPAVGTVFCVGDGSASACPCGNASPVGAGAGCLSSLGVGGTLRASGSASLALDTFELDGANMPDSSALYFQGTQQQNGGAGSAFGDGLRCAGGQIIRIGTRLNATGSSQFPDVGDPSISVRGLVTSPGVREYQCWYRNAANFCASSTYNLTNGLEITWTP